MMTSAGYEPCRPLAADVVFGQVRDRRTKIAVAVALAVLAAAVALPALAGANYKVKGKLTLAYNLQTSTFSGSVSSKKAFCEKGRKVSVYYSATARARDPQWSFVGSTKTNSLGDFRFQIMNAYDGYYMDKAAKKVGNGGDNVCLALVSVSYHF
jgi:hypothetical protein